LVYTNIYLLIEAVAEQIVNLSVGTHSGEWEWDSEVTFFVPLCKCSWALTLWEVLTAHIQPLCPH